MNPALYLCQERMIVAAVEDNDCDDSCNLQASSPVIFKKSVGKSLILLANLKLSFLHDLNVFVGRSKH